MFEFKKVRKKPVEVEAFQLSEEHLEKDFVPPEIELRNLDFTQGIKYATGEWLERPVFTIQVSDGFLFGSLGDWVIKDVNGELGFIEDDIFQKTYDIL